MRSHRDPLSWKIAVPALAALVLLVLGAMAAIADQDAVDSRQSLQATPKVKDMKVNVAGVQVSIDPKTGRLRPPTPDESQALARALRQQFAPSTGPLQAVQAENGALAMELPEDWMETVVLRTHTDGTQSLDCMSAEEAARIFEQESSMTTLPGLDAKSLAPRRPSTIRPKTEKE